MGADGLGSCVTQVNLKLFTPSPNKKRTVLLFVFRDRTRTPLSRLIQTWEEDLQQMWNTITKPPSYENYGFADFFEVCMQLISPVAMRTCISHSKRGSTCACAHSHSPQDVKSGIYD